MKTAFLTLILIFIFIISSIICIKNFNNNNQLFLSIIGTVLGGLFLSLIYFSLYEFFYRIPNLSGTWNFIEHTNNSAYKPYLNMQVTYLSIIWNEGTNIYGSGERIEEITTTDGLHKYPAKERINIEIQGNIKKRYFWNDEITIHYFENGIERKSSTIHRMELKSKILIEGNFFKTAANATGKITWKKEGENNLI